MAIAHAHDVPVIVEWAAQLPPVENLWQITAAGADLVIFRGRKDLHGPQSTGLVLGKPQWVEYARQCNAPRWAPGRPMKVSWEELLGILAAVEWYPGLDHPARLASFEQQIAEMIRGLEGLPGLVASRDWPNEAGQPLGRVLVTFAPGAALNRDQVVERLWRAAD